METISRPLTYQQLIKRSLKLYRRSFSHIILLSCLLGLTVFLPRLITHLTGKSFIIDAALLSSGRLWILLVNLVSLIFFIAILWRMHCVLRGVHEPLAEDVMTGLRKMLAVFIASILQYLIIFVATVVLFAIQVLVLKQQLLFAQGLWGALFTALLFFGQGLLILYLASLFFFLMPIIAVENKNIFYGLEKSALLVWNHWWRVFSVQMTPWLCYLFALIVIKYTFKLNIHIYFMSDGMPTFWSSALQLILFIFFIPWVASLLLVQLNDLELRKALATPHDKIKKSAKATHRI